MQIEATIPQALAVRQPESQPDRTDRHRETLRNEVRHQEHLRPGRRHLQRELKHLVRDVRHDILGELKELKETGDLDPEYAKAVKSLVGDFRDGLQQAYQAAGRGHDFDPAALEGAVGQAMADLTAGLAALRKQREGEVTLPVEPPAEAPAEAPVEAPAEAPAEVAAEAPLPVQNTLQMAFSAQLTVSFGLLLDLRV